MPIRYLFLTIAFLISFETTFARPAFVGANSCGSCHKKEFLEWQGSHHDKATGRATVDSVLGEFDGKKISTPTEKYQFDTNGQEFFVSITDENGQTDVYPVTHTFGLHPLQQYMIPKGEDRLQVLPVAWDTRPETEGGQRWFYLYDDPVLSKLPELKWDGYFNTWNGQCAECHATSLSRGFSATDDRFNTKFEELNVACEGCHGPGEGHPTKAVEGYPAVNGPKEPERIWQFADGQPVAHLLNREAHDSSQIDTCAACHSRRSSLNDGHQPGEAFLNQYAPALIEAPLYFADGQIHDEVYVYGSFLQSKMYQSGVICSDCHNPHSLETKAQGNDLCAQCHEPTVFDTKSHHRHNIDSDGGQCVNCHMASRTYMQVDDRRDHSFKVPRPLLSPDGDARSACQTCHQDKNNTWVRKSFDDWGIAPRADLFEAAQVALLEGETDAIRKLTAFYEDTDNATIKRATVIMQIARTTSSETDVPLLERAAKSKEPLIRYGVARGFSSRSQPVLLDAAKNLLNDPVKAVRIESARWIARIPENQLPPHLVPSMRSARKELVAVTESIAFLPDARLQLGVLDLDQGKFQKAAESFAHARRIAPSNARGWINEAEALRLQDKEEDAAQILKQGMEAVPEPAGLHYALGLSLVRQKQLETALTHFEQAIRIEPENEQYVYGHAVALLSSGRTDKALKALLSALSDHPNSMQLLSLAIDLARRTGDQKLAQRLMLQARRLTSQ